MSVSRITYRFGPLERRSILGGAGPGQVALVAVTLIGGVAILDMTPTLPGVLAAGTGVAAGLAVACLEAFGRPLREWLVLVLAFIGRRVHGATSFSHAPTAGHLGAGRRQRPDSAAPPRHLRGVAITAAVHRGQEVGLLAQDQGRRLSLVLACRVNGFSLLDPETRQRRLHSWGLLLASCAGGSIRRLQWVERTAPAVGDELARWLYEQRDPSLGPRGSAMVESYLELISSSSKVAQEHEILLAVQIEAPRSRASSRRVAEAELLQQTERIGHALPGIGVTVAGALGPAHLRRALRTAFDPYGRVELAADDAAGDGEVRDSTPWPLGAQESWEDYRCDGALHATYWIAGWPRSEVSPMFMEALLSRSAAVRAVSVCFEPLPIARATQEAQIAITRDRADRELRMRLGQLETARHRQSQAAAARREEELASGHGEVRFSGFVTVSGRDGEELRRACAEVHEHAARARLELRRMYGQQAEAFTFTLPLCRGLR